MPLAEVATDAVLGNSPERWLQALTAAAASIAVLWVLRTFVGSRLARAAAQTATLADDFAAELLRGIKTSLFVFVTLLALDAFLEFPGRLDSAVRYLLVLSLALQGFSWAGTLVSFWLARWARNNPQQSDGTTLAALGFAVRVGLWLLIVVLALQNLNIQVTALLTGLGVGGIAIALAVQNVLGDLFAALSIVLDKPFVLGDAIVVDQHEGVVEKIGLKTTRLRSINGEMVIFSNASLLRSNIRNLARREGRRYLVHTTVALQTDAAQLSLVPDIFTQAVAAQPYVTLQRSHLVGTTPMGHDFETAFLVTHADFALALAARQAILLRAYSAFQRESIVLAAAPVALVAPSAAP